MNSAFTLDPGGPVAMEQRRVFSAPDTTSPAWWFLGTPAVLRNPRGRRASRR